MNNGRFFGAFQENTFMQVPTHRRTDFEPILSAPGEFFGYVVEVTWHNYARYMNVRHDYAWRFNLDDGQCFYVPERDITQTIRETVWAECPGWGLKIGDERGGMSFGSMQEVTTWLQEVIGTRWLIEALPPAHDAWSSVQATFRWTRQ